MSTYNWREDLGPQRVVPSDEVRTKPWVPTRPELLWTVATEPERTRAAVVVALRNWAEEEVGFMGSVMMRERAEAIENGADW